MSKLTFDSLPEGVLRTRQRHVLKNGNVLFSEGAAAKSLFFVEKGCVRLVIYPVDGKQLVLYRGRDGEMLAEDHLVRSCYAYSAIADKASTVWSFDRSLLLQHIVGGNQVAHRYLRNMTDRYHQLQLNFERLGLPTAKAKVLHLLNSLCDEQRSADLTGRFKTLASDLNMAHETMYRALRDLENHGLIRRRKGIVTLIDPTK